MTASSSRATCWSLTINNPVASDEENIALARQKGWRVDGQKEIGKEGTPHYQLIVKTPQVRFSAMKKAFPRAHIEIARNPSALEQYVHKEDTKDAELSQDNELYPSLQKMWDMFYEYLTNKWKEHHVMNWANEKFLERFDEFISFKIEQGYVLETMAVNPQIRSSVKNYGLAIYTRSMNRYYKDLPLERQKSTDWIDDENISVDSQTDRQSEN